MVLAVEESKLGSNSTSVLFAGIILWISALSAKLVLRARSALLLGVYVTMPSTSTASVAGSKHVKCVH